MEIIDDGARSFYEYALLFVSIAIFYGYFPFVKLILQSKSVLPKLSWVLSLVLSDLLIATNIALGSLFLFTKDAGRTEFGCHFYAWMSLGCGFVNIASAAFVALDRHHRVMRPGYEEKNVLAKIVGVWALCFATAALPWLGVGAFDHVTKDTAMCLIDLEKSQVYIYSVAALWFVLPLAVMQSSYAELAKKSKDYQTMTPITGALLLCYTPYAIHAVASTTFGVTFPAIVTAVNHLFPKLLSVINPHLYLNDPLVKEMKENGEKNADVTAEKLD